MSNGHKHEGVDHADKMCARTCCPCNVNVDELKALMSKPAYICKGCGHVANDKLHLCEPTSIS